MISIITITRNNPDDLERTLASIPDYDFIESVVINGGDDKRSLDYLNRYKGKVINEKDAGIADAFNKGIRHSSGNAIMFLNSGDELIDAEYLNEAYQVLSENNFISFVHSNILFLDSLNAELFMKPQMKNPGRGMPYLHPTMMFRRKVFDEVGLFNLKYRIAMDFDFVVRMEKAGFKGFYLDKKNPVVKMEGSGKSAASEREAIKECFVSLKENNYLTINNLFGFSRRIILFYLRKFLLLFKAGALLKRMKKAKHSR